MIYSAIIMYMHAFACMQALLHIEIRQDFSWNIHSFGTSVVLNNINLPTAVNSVNLLIHLISVIEKYHFCTGNEDEKYHPLQAEKSGIFKGCTGQYMHACLYSFFEY